ncbi:saccharopine dehydrogenase family protein [Desulfurispirillum indicum]|uniref:Saccharopine dehydrogenase n=1 Tax=Desulfurispirillum indicum (strain ATCC BAA-1389 / DSM 22839 / S5) TaxID=653733 RepID=E6W789_DESIS|nr:saccharopine dehydrogenase C-terminal domain-containing protein [Desulfurispirillum indicum]ADU66256.1 Saccharopine dehydrogenase [Desulfurispirillum indicum S5]UCZ55588.1 saccharopine dehydrogenase family protein [Desulfurispirillum indicum]
MSTVLIIGAGGVGNVVARKCVMNPQVFTRVVLASRTLSKCEEIQRAVGTEKLEVAQVDADNVPELVALIRKVQPDLVLNVALPYQDLTIMDACLETGVDYLDTANYEPKDNPVFEYKYQWAYRERYEKRGIMALLGSGFDPGVTNVFCAYAQQYLFDEIHYVDILDCNGGDHGLPFATNFNPEINIREITANGRYWEDGEWKITPPLSESFEYDFEEVGPKRMYLLYHEELESLCRNIKGLKRIRFYMSFGEQYLTHLRVLQNVGMTSIEPIEFQGQQIVPLQFLKAVLPDPGDLGPLTKGKTNIGCNIEGIKDGKVKRVRIYNVCDHQDAYREVGSQAISYTTGVPAVIGAMLMVQKIWHRAGVFNMEEFDAKPFMELLNQQGLPWHIKEY